MTVYRFELLMVFAGLHPYLVFFYCFCVILQILRSGYKLLLLCLFQVNLRVNIFRGFFFFVHCNYGRLYVLFIASIGKTWCSTYSILMSFRSFLYSLFYFSFQYATFLPFTQEFVDCNSLETYVGLTFLIIKLLCIAISKCCWCS